ncbi:TonB-dependent siderophore receptor, partial [Aquimarina sp. RZ0]|uniref:TonB-dependent receptor plug domain-containing protein n=1 Tax=Aquimarina sp. RZ0 TaxID=2607730 RepID=UPI00165EFA83
DLLSVFNPYVTESVKVSRSFAALQYDSRVGGVIDITSKNSIPRDIGIGIGSNFTHADIYTEIPLGRKTGLILSGRRSYIDILDTPTEEMYSKRILGHRFWGFTAEGLFGTDVAVTENNNPQYQDYTTKIITDLSASSKLTISGFWHQGESDNKIYLNEDDSLSDFSSTEEDILENQNIGLGINWAKNWGTNFSITASGYYTNVTQEYRNSNFDTSGKTPELIEKFDLIGNLVDFGTSIHLDWQLHKKHTLTLGYNFSEATIQDSFQVPISLSPEDENSGSSFGFTVKNVTHAPYLEDLFKISNTISLSLGGKANYFSIYNRFYFEPRAGLTFLINKNITTNIFAERKHQVIDQRFDIPSPLFLVDFRFWRLRSPELFDPILKSDQISTSFSWNQKNWLIEFEGYYKKKYGIDDASNAVGDNNIIGFGSSDTFGIDLLIKKRIGRYNTWLSYSYIDQTFRFDDFKEKQPFSGSLDITHNISWIHSYLLGNFEFSLGWNIRTGKPYSPLEGITDQTSNGSHPLLFGDVNSKRLDPYHRMDFSASYRFTLAKDSKWRGKAALSIINLYDKKNVLDRRGTILNRENRSIASEFDVISLGFTPNISLRFDF